MNANGVRDDVERDIANKSKDINLYQSFLKLAAAHQNILVKPIPVTREEALGRAKGIVCALGAGVDISPTFTVAKVLGIDWSILTYNTPERKKKRLDVYSVLGTYDGEEVLCQ